MISSSWRGTAWTITGTLLVVVKFLVPMDSTGIRDGVTPTFGVESSF